MANVINLNITPLYPIQTDAYPLSSPTSTPGRPTLAQPPKKRLRSCMSPARSRPTTPFEDRDLCSGFTSRSASYGSERSKSVRWEGEVPVTSYFDTYSRDEYDRTPLAAPSAEERACVLPPRDSRCMTRSYQCFLDTDKIERNRTPSPIHESPLSSPALAALDAALTSIVEVPCEALESDDEESEYPDIDEEEEDEDEDEDDGQWEECMERRRMMFARMCGQDADRHPQFDGYRSLSSTLANILKSVGCEDDIPLAAPVGIEAVISTETLELSQCPLDTPSLTSGSSDSEPDTFNQSLPAIIDTIATSQPLKQTMIDPFPRCT